MTFLIKMLVFMLLLVSVAFAGGRGGHNTTFDCNVWGGSCACFMSAASNKCGNAAAHFSNATCNGGDDSVALADWITYGHGLGAAMAVLFIPPGCIEGNFGGGNNSFSADITVHCAGFGAQPVTTIQNAVIWGYGTTFPQLSFGGLGFFNARNTQGVETGCGSGPTNTSPLIQAATAGDSILTLVTAAESSNFTVGDHVVVAAIGTQGNGSFPPNPQLFEHKLITAINGVSGVLTIDSPLQLSYKTTYPDIGGTAPYEGGPATVYLMEKTYNNISQYFGMTVSGLSNQTNVLGRSIALTDVTVGGNGIAPTQSEAIWLFGGYYESQEVDKNVDLFVLSGVNMGAVIVQSASIKNMIVQNSNVRRFWGGTPLNAAITNTKTPSLFAGPSCCGQASSLALDGVTVATAVVNYHHTLISAYSFSSGTLTIAKANTEYTNGTSLGIWVPGHKYFAGDSDGSNTCSPANTFTVTDVQDAGTNVNIITDLVSVTFGNTCGAGTRPPTTFGSYQVMSLTQKFSGPANLLSNPEMLPP